METSNSKVIEIVLTGATAELACKVGASVWLALGKARTVRVSFADGEIYHRAEATAVSPATEDLYVCASLNQTVIVSARCLRGSTAHARAVKAAKSMWPNHTIESLTIAELAACEMSGKKILTAEGLPSI